jgi:hypothetical protein
MGHAMSSLRRYQIKWGTLRSQDGQRMRRCNVHAAYTLAQDSTTTQKEQPLGYRIIDSDDWPEGDNYELEIDGQKVPQKKVGFQYRAR